MDESQGRWRFALLANHVVITEGLLHMLGAGWTQLMVTALPTLHVLNLAAEAVGVPDNGVITARVLDPGGTELASSSTLVFAQGGPQEEWMIPTTVLALTFPVALQVVGLHRVVLEGAAGNVEVEFQVQLTR